MWINDREKVKTRYGAKERNFYWSVNAMGLPIASVPDENGLITLYGETHCRDTFHQLHTNNDLKTYYYCHNLPKGRGRSIADFVNQVETILGLAEKSEFQATQKRKVLKVCPAKFWTKENMRKSFFTALLRAALDYRITKKNFDKALWDCTYFAWTKKATKRFLEGYTHYTGNSVQGWVSTFQETAYNKPDFTKVLVKPKEKKNESQTTGLPSTKGIFTGIISAISKTDG